MMTSIFNTVNTQTYDTISDDGYPVLCFGNPEEKYLTKIKMNDDLYNNDQFWRSINSKILTLVYNRVKFEDKLYTEQSEIIEFINNHYLVYAPNEKLEVVLKFLHSLTSYDGQRLEINLEEDIISTELWRKLYLANSDEFEFYVTVLYDNDYINYLKSGYSLIDLYITIKGMSYLSQKNPVSSSRNCFVAMSFDPKLQRAYEDGILPAIKETGFIPVIVSNVHVDSDKTINDAIIAGIKEAKFVIADFTMHKAGVYFEAGYALGRGLKVIYTCSKKDLRKAHFDTRNFQHIVWETPEELKYKLIDKIKAFVLN